nr:MULTISPECIES: DUF2284 domain-containing protein [Desulfitobacterium]
MVQIDLLCSLAKSLGAAHAALIAVDSIKFNHDFRKQCEQNTCGSYDKNWMCPPNMPSIDELRDKVLPYDRGLLFQTVYQLKNSFDWRGVQQAVVEHTQVFRKVLAELRSMKNFLNLLPLNVGPCTYCGRCSFLDGEECRFPEEAIPSVEAYGIDVMALEKSCGMPYYNGKDTVSCVSLILFRF